MLPVAALVAIAVCTACDREDEPETSTYSSIETPRAGEPAADTAESSEAGAVATETVTNVEEMSETPTVSDSPDVSVTTTQPVTQ